MRCSATDVVGDLLAALVARGRGLLGQLLEGRPARSPRPRRAARRTRRTRSSGSPCSSSSARRRRAAPAARAAPRPARRRGCACRCAAAGAGRRSRSPPARRSSVRLGQQVVGVEVGELLGPVQAPVVVRASPRDSPHRRLRYSARGPTTSLFSRLVRCRPSRRNSRAAASWPVTRRPRAGQRPGRRLERGQVGEHRQVVGRRQVVAHVDHHLGVEGGRRPRRRRPG